ncbi:MAG: hypothetical protein WC979_02360 [Candidatus Pacearchaeota archaeon]|jgi:hypothetical protein|nr:hypothetical protein [Clostridia bacterium]
MEKTEEQLEKTVMYVTGELEGIPVWYHEENDKNSIQVSFGPIEQDPNAGRLIMMPGYREPSPQIGVIEGNGELSKIKIDKSKYAVCNSEAESEFVCAKPTGDPTKAYYADNGEPWVPFKTKYKACFIITGYTDFEEFKTIHGESTLQRISEKLKLHNGESENCLTTENLPE